MTEHDHARPVAVAAGWLRLGTSLGKMDLCPECKRAFMGGRLTSLEEALHYAEE